MCLSGILGLGSAAIGAISSGNAADDMVAASQQQIALQEQIYNDQRELFQPFYDGGLNAFAAQQNLLGLGPAPTIGGSPAPIETVVIPGTPGGQPTNALFGDMTAPVVMPEPMPYAGVSEQGDRRAGYTPSTPQGTASTTQYQVNGQTFATLEEAQAYAAANPVGGTPYGGFQASPGYQFALGEGLSAIDASASAGGGLYSGATMQAAQEYGQGLANQEFNNYYNQVAGIASGGQAAAGQQAQAGANYATGASNALANMGNAQAAGAIGVGNALQSGINTGLGLYQYQNNLNQPQNALSLF